ncbi:MAG: cytochrome c oxidase subunit 2 [candidate division Zixibacteria bacterium RBG-1]|nr:MAG: cytochrome c oxidase subunit 2 [candidate division Zixibacteria bacterium RBG-1]
MKKKILIFATLFIALFSLYQILYAEQPLTNWLQNPATPLAKDVRTNFWISMLAILPFLLLSEGLLFYAIVKFKAKPNAKPATFHENVRLEIAWTILPALALIIIAFPTFTTLKKMEVPPKSDLVVEVIGHQFFWEYKYPKYEINFAEKPLVVPVNKVVTLNCTSVDVIHSWFVPAFGVKQDANPGRITHAWFKALQTGTYKGQCAELCGALHALMYITVKVVTDEEFETWLEKNKPVPVTPTEATAPVKSKT